MTNFALFTSDVSKCSRPLAELDSDETIIESQSKIEYFGHNRMQLKL